MSKDATRKEGRCLFLTIDADMFRLAHDACQAKANNGSSPSRVLATIYIGTSALWAAVVAQWESTIQFANERHGVGNYELEKIDVYSDKTAVAAFRQKEQVAG